MKYVKKINELLNEYESVISKEKLINCGQNSPKMVLFVFWAMVVRSPG